MKNDNIKLGQLIEGEAQCDAIHIAIAPVTAFRSLSPGEPVGLTENGEADNLTAEPIGIVDPFLKARVPRGERFYLVLFPGTITGLRHEWTHPAFAVKPQEMPAAADKAASEAWLRQYAARVMDEEYGNPFENLISDIRQRALTLRGHDCHSFGEVPDPELLFHHASVYLGERVEKGQFEYFSCTC